MVHIKVTKGLNIPIKGKPEGQLQTIVDSGHVMASRLIGLDLTPFEDLKFKLLVKVGDVVKIGQPLLEDRSVSGLMFASPAGGVIKEIRRGLKRVLKDIIIELRHSEEQQDIGPLDVNSATRFQLIEKLKAGGLFPHIRKRPFNQMANPNHIPRAIFVKALESAPFVPCAKMQIQGYEKEFQIGLDALAKLTDGSVHLVYRKGSTCQAFTEAKGVQKHTAEGPHPVSNYSVHIHYISQIVSAEEVVWTLTAYDVACIGYLLSTGRYLIDKVISIGGPAVLPGKRGFFKGRAGYLIEDLIAGRIEHGVLRLISGDVLMGKKAEISDFLGFYHNTFSVIPENTDREFLHFLRLGSDKYTASGAYLSGHLNNENRKYDFTTSLHGERRAFVTSAPYEKVMPLRIPTMELVKSVMAEDYDLAEALGLLEVDAEDFALPTFVDPSKIEMVEIIDQGLKQHAKEVAG